MYDEIFLFGDSITQQGFSSGWVALLSDAYIRRLRVVNNGLSGYNTRQALRVLPQLVPPPEKTRIRLLTLFFGANDARVPSDDASPQHIPLPEFRENVRKIVTHPAIQAHDPRIVLFTPPPIIEGMFEKLREQVGIHRTPGITASYANAVREVGKELGVPVVDVWSAFIKRTGWKEGEPLPGTPERQEAVLPTLLNDGLHLTPAGNLIVFDELMEVVTTNWPELVPEKLSTPLPWWDDVSAWNDYD